MALELIRLGIIFGFYAGIVYFWYYLMSRIGSF